jgi:hypothetical protein
VPAAAVKASTKPSKRKKANLDALGVDDGDDDEVRRYTVHARPLSFNLPGMYPHLLFRQRTREGTAQQRRTTIMTPTRAMTTVSCKADRRTGSACGVVAVEALLCRQREAR